MSDKWRARTKRPESMGQWQQYHTENGTIPYHKYRLWEEVHVNEGGEGQESEKSETVDEATCFLPKAEMDSLGTAYIVITPP